MFKTLTKASKMLVMLLGIVAFVFFAIAVGVYAWLYAEFGEENKKSIEELATPIYGPINPVLPEGTPLPGSDPKQVDEGDLYVGDESGGADMNYEYNLVVKATLVK